MWQVSPSSQLLSLHHSQRIHVPQQKIPHETMKISSATTKTLLSQIDLKKTNSVADSHIWQYGYQDNLDHSPTGNNKKYCLYQEKNMPQRHQRANKIIRKNQAKIQVHEETQKNKHSYEASTYSFKIIPKCTLILCEDIVS